jgi:hypothetical protein
LTASTAAGLYSYDLISGVVAEPTVFLCGTAAVVLLIGTLHSLDTRRHLRLGKTPIAHFARVPSQATLQRLAETYPHELEVALAEHIAREAEFPHGKIPEE